MLPILVLALQLISAIVVIDRSLAADELGLSPHESADGTTRVGVIQNDPRFFYNNTIRKNRSSSEILRSLSSGKIGVG